MPGADSSLSTIPQPFDSEIEEFLQFIELERGLSKHSINNYASDLAQFVLFLVKSENCQSWDSVTQDHVKAYVRHMSEVKHYAVSSLNRKLSAIKVFSKFRAKKFVESGNSESKDFAELIQRPHHDWQNKVPKYISVKEYEQIVAMASPASASGMRDRAILEVIYASGIRVTELCNLRIGDVDLIEGFVRVFGKGSKERLAPLGTHAVKAVSDYLSVGRPAFVRAKTDQTLFLSRLGGKITSRSIERMVQNLSIKAKVRLSVDADGVERTSVTPHVFRHSYATHMLQGGADLRVIQETLGHQSVATTQIYAKADAEMISDVHAACHPRKKMADQ